MKHLIARKNFKWPIKPSTRPKRLRVEQLERRDLMTASPFDPLAGTSHAMCNCPICTGRGLPQQIDTSITSNASTTGGTSAAATVVKYSLSSLPELHSLAGATAKLVLDFNGNTLSSWGGRTNVVTPAYDIDGDSTTFSDQELANIREIWKRVAEDYAPFKIDVTTADPGVLTDKVVAKIAIGGSNADWYKQSAGGVAYIGGFSNAASNVGFAFAKNLGSGNARYVADAVSHESGHLFGLQHQALWNGTTLVSEYSQGNANWAPIMGVGYYSAVTTWANGATSASSTSYQDNMAVIASSANGFGYRVNTIGSAATAGTLGTTGTFSVAGLVAQNTDQQWWKFTTAGGNAAFNVNNIGVGANLDSVLEIRNASGVVVYTANSSTSMNSTLSVSLASGTYYAVVRSTGVYGYVGQYSLTGSFVPSNSTSTTSTTTSSSTSSTSTGTPEITVLDGAKEIVSWTTQTSLGSVTVGSFVEKTFTIRNDGNGTLTLQAIDLTTLPSWLTIVTNVDKSSLLAGESTTFVVRFTPTVTGSFSGTLKVRSNDASEATYVIQVSGSATAGVTQAQSLAMIDLVLSEWTKRR